MGADRRVGPSISEIDLGIEGLVDPVLIGQGGFGAVYRAEQPALGRTVAAKILSAPGLDDRTRERFERECVAIGALSGHPHIVTVYDSGINSWGRPYIVMDFMAGGSTADRVSAHGPLPWSEAVDLAVKITSAMATAHSASILHRDIKPQNVLISSFGEPKLGDFGISSIGGEQTSSGTVTASLEHAAPELLDGSPASVVTDLYAIASTVFTLIAGHPPFARESDEPIQSLIARILGGAVPDLRPRGVPGAVCAVLERALATDPGERYESANELAISLRDAQEQQGVVPTPFVEANVGGFELLERFAPSGGTTGPTRTRSRAEFVPPRAPEEPTPLWKRRVFVASVVVVLVALAATAIAMTRPNDPEATPAPDLVAQASEVTPTTVAEEPRSPSKRDNGSDRRDRARKRPRNDGRGDPSAALPGIPPPAPDSAGVPSTVSSGHATSSGTNGSSGGGGGGGEGGSPPSDGAEPKEKEPPKPPPPDVWLYHLWKGPNHVATINPAAYPSDYARQAEGLVYDYRAKGTIPIATAEGTMYVFAEPFGDTEPDVNRTTLYKMTKGSEYFYTSSGTKKANYYTRWDWSAQETGYIGQR